MKKRVLAMLTGLIMIIGLLGGCANTPSDSSVSDPSSQTGVSGSEDVVSTGADPETPEDLEFVEFTVYSLDDDPDIKNWPLVKEAMQKFNFDFTIQQVAWDNWGETTRTLVATESLPEVLAWYDLQYGEYLSWAQQGVFKPLPDDLNAYPNLKKITEDFSIFDSIRVDDKLYAFPKTIHSNPWYDYDHTVIMYRRDIAQAIGKDFDPVQPITWDELVTYLKEVKEKDPTGLGDMLVPYDTGSGGLSWVDTIRRFWNPDITTFTMIDGKYEWGGKDPSSLEGITKLHDLYTQGLLAPDAYADVYAAGDERFLAGRTAVFEFSAVPQRIQEYSQNLAKTIGIGETDFGIFCLQNDDGKYPISQKSEWWAAMAFSADCRDEVMERWLMVGDWLLEPEQLEKAAYGEPGTDWTKENDELKLNWTMDDITEGGTKQYITQQENVFLKFFVLEGNSTWLPGNPMISEYALEDLYHTMMDTYASNPAYTPTNYDVEYFSSEVYDSIAGAIKTETGDAVIRAVIADDPAAEWNSFIESKLADAQKAADELNDKLAP